MKKLIYISVISLIVGSCSTGQFATSGSYSDDLYYNPDDKPLVVQEVEKEMPELTREQQNEYVQLARETVKKSPEKYPDITNLDRITVESVQLKENTKTGAMDTIIEIMSQGYWINGFRGTEAERQEAMRTIEQYPNGFGYFGNGYSIGQNLSFDSDWNVYTRNDKYWWFPRTTNLTMYNQFMFGRYPRMEWTIAWDSPHYDYWDFDMHFGYNSSWRWRSYDRWGWSGYDRWRWGGSGWYYSPHSYGSDWYFHSYYSDPWYRSSYWYGYPYYRNHYGYHRYGRYYGDRYYRRGPVRYSGQRTYNGDRTVRYYNSSSNTPRYRRGNVRVSSKHYNTSNNRSNVRTYTRPKSSSRPVYNRSNVRRRSTGNTVHKNSNATYGRRSSSSSSNKTYNRTNTNSSNNRSGSNSSSSGNSRRRRR